MDSSGKPSTTQIVVFATSSALTALFYSIYRNRATTVARLKVSHISAHSVFVTWMSQVCLYLLLCYVPFVNLQSLSLQEAKKMSIDQDLKNILSETPGRCVPYAVIEGLLKYLQYKFKLVQSDLTNWIYIIQNSSFTLCLYLLLSPGVVRNVKETLSSQFVDNCKGVIERLTLKEEKMVWNRTTHLW